MRLSLLLLVSALAAPCSSAAAPWRVQSIPNPSFRAVAIWAPPPGTPGAFPAVLLLHGNQPGAGNPTWMVDLHYQPAFADRILIAPALGADGYEWGETKTVRALAALLDELARRYPIDRARIHLAGYSAGAARVLSVARTIRFASVTAIAGDVLRPFRAAAVPLPAVPLLLVCMTSDDHPHTSCKLNEENLRALARRGAREAILKKVPGTHSIDFAVVGPVVDEWVRRHDGR